MSLVTSVTGVPCLSCSGKGLLFSQSVAAICGVQVIIRLMLVRLALKTDVIHAVINRWWYQLNLCVCVCRGCGAKRQLALRQQRLRRRRTRPLTQMIDDVFAFSPLNTAKAHRYLLLPRWSD